MSNEQETGQVSEQVKISPIKMLLNVIGMILIMFGAYEMYSIHETGAGSLSELIGWIHYPWALIFVGIGLMVPFHIQLFKAYKLVKKQQKEWEERNKPKF